MELFKTKSNHLKLLLSSNFNVNYLLSCQFPFFFQQYSRNKTQEFKRNRNNIGQQHLLPVIAMVPIFSLESF